MLVDSAVELGDVDGLREWFWDLECFSSDEGGLARFSEPRAHSGSSGTGGASCMLCECEEDDEALRARGGESGCGGGPVDDRRLKPSDSRLIREDIDPSWECSVLVCGSGADRACPEDEHSDKGDERSLVGDSEMAPVVYASVGADGLPASDSSSVPSCERARDGPASGEERRGRASR